MIVIPTKQRSLEQTILHNTYCRSMILEISALIHQETVKGKFAIVYGFPPCGEYFQDIIVDYLKLKKYRVIYISPTEHGRRVKIEWK